MEPVKAVVIMSVYRSDSLTFFIDAVNSILNQTKPCQLLIYRDGPVSEDVQLYMDSLSTHERVNIFWGDVNKGLAFALNYLIDKALDIKAEYILRMDSDDIALAYRVEKQVEFMDAHPSIGVSGSSCEEFGATFAIEKKSLPSDHQSLISFSIVRCPFIHPTVIFRASVLGNGIRYPEDTYLTEDMALWFSLLYSGVRFANMQDVLLKYRLNELTLKRRKGISKAISEVKLRFKYMYLLDMTSAKNVLLICARLVFHLLPFTVVKFIYKKLR